MKFNKKNTLKKSLFAVGAVTILAASSLELIGAVTSISTRVGEGTFSGLIVNAEAPVNKSCQTTLKQEKTPTHITINKAQINLPVVGVALSHGTWAVNDGVANYAEETNGVSSISGNVGIYAHDRSNGFTRIKNLQKNDLIVVTTSSGEKATYKVTDARTIAPTDVKAFYPTKKPTLTLITCDGVFSEQRHIVRASLVSIQKGNCHA